MKFAPVKFSLNLVAITLLFVEAAQFLDRLLRRNTRLFVAPPTRMRVEWAFALLTSSPDLVDKGGGWGPFLLVICVWGTILYKAIRYDPTKYDPNKLNGAPPKQVVIPFSRAWYYQDKKSASSIMYLFFIMFVLPGFPPTVSGFACFIIYFLAIGFVGFCIDIIIPQIYRYVVEALKSVYYKIFHGR